MRLLQHLYSTGANFIDIDGLAYGEGVQDEILVSVPDEYIDMEGVEDKYDGGDEEEEEVLMGTASIVKEVIFNINDLLDNSI